MKEYFAIGQTCVENRGAVLKFDYLQILFNLGVTD